MKKQLDIGCGSLPAFENNGREGYEHFGVDINTFEHVKAADLAIEQIPYDSDQFDLVTAYDFLEHIPSFVYLPSKTMPVKRNCMIELFNEVYRVLKDGGTFFFVVPMAGTTEYYRDPTHVYPWTQQSLHYFTGDYYGHHDDYGHTSKFELLNYDVIDNWRLQATLVAKKPCNPPFSVGAVT